MTRSEHEAQFVAELKALLAKYDATIEADVDVGTISVSAWPQRDSHGNVTAPMILLNLGSHLSSKS